MNSKAAFYIDKLMLQRHPEGGYYNEIYRSGEIYLSDLLPTRYSGNRNYSTSIYYLLEGDDKSSFHKLNSDEIWHFYDGCSIRIYILDQVGNLSEITLGKNLESGEVLQVVILKENWFAAEIIDKGSFSLVGCTVSPGFEFSDFTLGSRSEMLGKYPQFGDLILRFTKG